MGLGPKDIGNALLFSEIERMEVTYAYADERSQHERTTYLIRNSGTQPLGIVALGPRLMEMQVNMTAVVDGASAPIIPSSRVAAEALEFLGNGLRPELAEELRYCLLGGKGEGDREEVVKSGERIREYLRSARLSEPRRQFVERVWRLAVKKKYAPLVLLRTPLEPGDMVLVEYRRVRFLAGGTLSRIWGQFVSGRLAIRQIMPIGLGTHSTHISTKAPPGGEFAWVRVPAHWPDVRQYTVTVTDWHIYLSKTEKYGIYDGQRKHGVDPEDVRFGGQVKVRNFVSTHVALLVVFLAASLQPFWLITHPDGAVVLDFEKLLTVLFLAGGTLTTVLLANRDAPFAFHYIGAQAFYFVGIAALWISFAANPAALTGPGGWVVPLWVSQPLWIKELLLAMMAAYNRFKL